MNPFLISQKCPTLVGCGTSFTAADKMKELGCKKVMIVCDSWMYEQESFKAFLGTFAGIETYVWNKVIPDPTDVSVGEGLIDALNEKIDGIVGIGGGSSMDTAKGINTLIHSEPPVNQYFADLGPYAKMPNPGVPMILIPTTSGTGSETSTAAVIMNTELHAKNTLFVPNCIPDLAIVDANWTVTMPPRLTASSGFDALSHAFETVSSSFWNPMSETIALSVVDIVWRYLERAYKDGTDMEAREYMHYAASAVALGFDDSMINLGHEIAHMIGAKYHIQHGECCAMVSPACLKFLAGVMPDRVGRIAKNMGLDPKEEGLGQRVYDALIEFRGRVGLQPASAYNLDKDEFMAMAEVLAQPYFLTYQMTKDDYIGILTDILSE